MKRQDKAGLGWLRRKRRSGQADSRQDSTNVRANVLPKRAGEATSQMAARRSHASGHGGESMDKTLPDVPEGHKVCIGCHKIVAKKDYKIINSSKKGTRHARCTPCLRAQWRASAKDRYKRKRNNQLWITHKFCRHCGITKPLDHYSVQHRDGKDRRNSKCKQCVTIVARLNYVKRVGVKNYYPAANHIVK